MNTLIKKMIDLEFLQKWLNKLNFTAGPDNPGRPGVPLGPDSPLSPLNPESPFSPLGPGSPFSPNSAKS